MSFQDISDVLRHSKAGGIDKLILICIANYTDENHEAYPSYNRLADDAGVERRTVIRAIDRLIELKELVKIDQGGLFNGHNQSNTYLVTLSHQGGDPKSLGWCPKVTGVVTQSHSILSLEPIIEPKSADSVDEGFISELKNLNRYAFLDIDVEISKMKQWLEKHPGRPFSKQFVRNWLNKDREAMLAKPINLRPRDGLGRPLGWEHEDRRI